MDIGQRMTVFNETVKKKPTNRRIRRGNEYNKSGRRSKRFLSVLQVKLIKLLSMCIKIEKWNT